MKYNVRVQKGRFERVYTFTTDANEDTLNTWLNEGLFMCVDGGVFVNLSHATALEPDLDDLQARVNAAKEDG